MCDGYDPDFAPIRSHTPVRKPSTSPSLVSTSDGGVVGHVLKTRSHSAPSFLLPLLPLESDNERISLQFYVKHAGPALAQASNSAFWQRQLLQAAHQHASVQHCVIALGAMYRRFFDHTLLHNKDAANRNLQFALSQSNKAIQRLIQDQTETNRTGTVDKLTAMTCCVLFGSMANLQSQREAAMNHLRSGMRMLRETKLQNYDDRERHPVNINSLRSIFTGLDIQARSSISWEDIQNWEPVVRTMRDFEPVEIDIHSPWALSEVHCRIETLLNDTLAFNRGCVVRPSTDCLAVQYEHVNLVARFQRITDALDFLSTTSLSFTVPEQSSSKTLLLVAQTHHWLRSSIAPLKQHFDVTSPLSQIPFDPTKHFEDMMPHIEYLLSLTNPSTPVYSAAPGPLAALWLIGVSAPSSCVALRKKAIDLIHRHPRREGLFDGQMMGAIGTLAWRLEQDAAKKAMARGADVEVQEDLVVPDHLRFVYLDVQYAKDDDHKAKVKFANSMQLMKGEATIVDLEY